MKKLSLLVIFLLVSCAETVKEESELERCINANASLIQNITAERLDNYPDLLQLPVKVTVDYLKLLFSEVDDEEAIKNVDNLSNKDSALASLKYLISTGWVSMDTNINLDADEVYLTFGEDVLLKNILEESELDYREVFFPEVLSSTIKYTKENTIKKIAENFCNSQGIY